MDKVISILRKNNIKATHQRIQVYKILLDNKGHLTAEEIYEKIKPEVPAVSLATIYKTLSFFKRKGLLNELRIKFDKSCFEARNDFHHHFFCRECGKIYHIDMKQCTALEERRINGHLIEEFQGYFYGTCKDCQKG